jgi:flagellar basal body-associated protein FliL
MYNQKGFAHVWLIVGIAVVIATGGFAFYRVVNNENSQKNQNTAQANETEIKSYKAQSATS